MKQKTAKKSNRKLALITGGAQRIGKEIAITLAKNGYDILINYNNSKIEAEELTQYLSHNFKINAYSFKANLLDISQAKKLAKYAKSIEGSEWKLLVNNASIFNKSKFLEAASDELENNMNIHFYSPLILSKEFAINCQEKSIKDAQIINLIDKNIARYDTSYFYYLLSKKSLAELTKMLALQLAPQIRVNGISPGFILNPIDDGGILTKQSEEIIKKIPLQTKGDVENICQAVEFLLKNNFVNGQILAIDGGASLNHAG